MRSISSVLRTGKRFREHNEWQPAHLLAINPRLVSKMSQSNIASHENVL
jgi:hypothetical protein